ncbi:MAG: hypothetical protein D6748_00685, partial [Calditrichaeota bacterium]
MVFTVFNKMKFDFQNTFAVFRTDSIPNHKFLKSFDDTKAEMDFGIIQGGIMNRLRLFLSIVLVSLLSLYLLQCSSNNSDSGGENTIVNPPVNSGLVGTWQSVNFAIVSATDTSVTVDLSVYGVNLTMNLNSDSTYSSATTFQGQDITESGIYSVHGNQ